jgi:DNA-binding transcriptional LysR family regulator
VFCGATHPLAAGGVLSPGSSEGQRWISLGTASPFEQHVREMLEEAGVVTPRSEITVLGEAMLLLRLLAQGRHLSVLPRFPTRLLRQYFPIVELALGARPQSRNIHLWCRSTMLEDPAFVAIKDSILAQAARAGEAS